MKKSIKLIIVILFLLLNNKTTSQTCSSPFIVTNLNGVPTPIDSFSTQKIYYLFTANNPYFNIKVYLKNFGLFGAGAVNVYNNDCSNLPSNIITTTISSFGDTIFVSSDQFIQGSQYLIEIISGISPAHQLYSLSLNNMMLPPIWNCQSGGPCPVTNTCELVCNGGFEHTSGQVNGPGLNSSFNTYAWGDANAGTSDLFSINAVPNCGYNVPCNVNGNQNTNLALSTCSVNNNYIGSIYETNYFFSPPTNYTEYIQTKFTYSMEPNANYLVSFYINKGDNSGGTLNSLGIWFRPTQFNFPTADPISITPNKIITNTFALNDVTGWNRVSFCYQASGGEQWMTIGRPAGSPIVPQFQPSSFCTAPVSVQNLSTTVFMYFDEVSVKKFTIEPIPTQTVNVCGSVNLNPQWACNVVPNTTITYAWSGTQTLSSTSILNPIATVTSSTSFFLNVTGATMYAPSCVATAVAAINAVTLTPVVISSSSTTVCPGSSVTLTASGASSFTWFPGNVLGNVVTFSPTANTTYTAIGTTTNGCKIAQTIAIFTYTSTISASASPNSICSGFSSTLTGLNGSNFTWQPGSLSGTTVVVTPAATTIYTVSGLSVNGCTKTNTVQVTVNNPPLLSVSPSASNTICLNSSINLIPSGAVTYTWLPMNTPTTNIVVSPATATTYTVNGTSIFGCIGTTTVSVFVNPLPNVTCSLTTPVVCPNTSATLSAGGAITFTWFPGNVPLQTAIFSPSVTTNYTVIGTSALGCTNSCVLTQSVYPLTANFFTIVASPTIICTAPPNLTTATLSVIGPPNYTWVPSNIINSPITTSTPGTYFASATFTNGCIYTKSLTLNETTTYASINPTIICSNAAAFDLYSISTPSSGCSFSVNGVPSSNIFGPNPSPGVYTIEIVCTASILCSNYAINTITVLAAPSIPTISGSYSVACIGDQFTVTAAPPTQTYTWFPYNFVGNPLVITPTAATTVTLASGPSQCSLSAPYIIPFFNATCVCVQNCGSILTGTITNGIYSSQVFCIPTTLFISGVVTFSNADLRIAPNVSIVVTPGSALNILGSHLYACDKMWSGIVVKQGGQVNMFPSAANTPFIEDALIAVNVEPYNINANATNILTVENATFNKNIIGIKIGHYRRNQNNYPFTVKSTLFTMRDIPFTTLSWPLTNTTKTSPSGGSSMQTPYINNTTYSVTGLKANNVSTVIITYGMVIQDVGYTNIPLGATFKDMTVGQNGGGSSGFNCFDNLHVDIYSLNSNVTVINSVFQNGNYANRSIVPTGVGIYAVASHADDVFNHNYRLQVFPGTPSGNFLNKFYDKKTCVDVTRYLQTEIKFAECYSSINDYSNSTYISNGFLVNTNRYIKIHETDNKFYNIGNSMMVSLDVGFFSVGPAVGSGRFVGSIVANKNLIKNHITTPTSGEYVNIGIAVQDPLASSSISYAPTGVHTRIFENTITNVHNGIDVKNMSFATTDINKNNITLVNEPNTYIATPIQYGINAEQCQFKAVINQNSVTGVPNYSPGVHAINTALNALMSIRCNTTSFTNRGIQFNNGQTVDVYEDNIMKDQNLGMVLDNNAVLTNTLSTNIIGNLTRPTNNVWTFTWTPGGFKTATFGGSSAQNGKMYIDITSSALNPTGSGTTTGPAGIADYFHIPSNSLNTLLNVTQTSPIGCRISNNNNNNNNNNSNNNNNNNNAQNVLASMVSGSITYSINPVETQMINKHMAYRTLKVNQGLLNNSSVLTNFYNNAQNTCLQQLCAIEDDLMNTDYINAQIKINSFNPSCQIETNYKDYYQILKRTKDSTYTISDSLNLISLANQCPYIDGGVVFQARALYNILYKGYYKFTGNCSSNYSSRENTILENDEIGVILKSKLYPNPNNGAFKIELQNSSKTLKFTVLIYDIMGKAVFKSEYPATAAGTLEIDSKLLRGTYLVKVIFEDNSADIHRLIID
jgi:hypothetical protein